MSKFTDMFYDMDGLSSETFSDIETDSLDLYDSNTDNEIQDFPATNLIQDTHFYSRSNSHYKNLELRTIFDTEDFPMDLLDIKEEIEEDVKTEVSEEVFNKRMLEAGERIQTLMVPVINMKTEQEKYLAYKSDSEESEISCESSVSSNTDNDEEQLEDEEAEDPKYWSLRTSRRRHLSSESEDADWEPEPEKPVRRCGKKVREGARRSQHVPVPQKRKTGTKKITQWIMSLLHDPQYNPRVVSWENEEDGTFRILDTAKYAKIWGERKRNPSMNYEKLSRAMRYYYKNGELIAVDRRTTYQFGPKSEFWRSRSSIKDV